MILRIQQHPASQLEEMFQWPTDGPSLIPVTWIVVAGLAVVSTVFVIWLFRSLRNWLEHPGPIYMFNRIAGDLGIGPTQRLLLVAITKQQKLPSPVTLLLSPWTLSYHADRYASTLPPWLARRVEARVEALSAAVFTREAGGESNL